MQSILSRYAYGGRLHSKKDEDEEETTKHIIHEDAEEIGGEINKLGKKKKPKYITFDPRVKYKAK
jgi:hypothetical protein